MDNQQLTAFYEQLATDHYQVQHTPTSRRFCQFNVEEIFSKLRQELDLLNYCVLLEAPGGELSDNNGDQIMDNQHVAYLVVRQVEKNDFATEQLVLTESKQIGLDMLARFMDMVPEFRLIDAQFSYDKVGPIFTNAFGYRFSYQLSQELNLRVNPTRWLSLSQPDPNEIP